MILGEAFLSFIGLGISPPDSSLGQMAEEDVRRTARPERHRHPQLIIATIVLVARTSSLDGMRDALDPRTTGDLILVPLLDGQRPAAHHFFTREGAGACRRRRQLRRRQAKP